MPLHIVILAAGQGKRMQSTCPKVLHHLGGQPLLQHILNTAQQLTPEKIHIIYGHQGEQLQKAFPSKKLNWIEQAERLGTGHALQQALPSVPDDAQLLVLSGDVPLISFKTLQSLINSAEPGGLALLSAEFLDPTGLGRVKRDNKGKIKAIVEERDATDEERTITEIYSGIMLAPAAQLKNWLAKINNNNAQKEYYLTDVIALAVKAKAPISSVTTHHCEEVQGVNTRLQLNQLERYYQLLRANELLLEGTTIADPARFDVRGDLKVGKDVFIDVNVIFKGTVILGDHVVIGPNCVFENVRIGDHVEVKANTVIEDAKIGSHCTLGPFARVRPMTILDEHVKVGNFVEIKKSKIGSHSKVSHLSYIGDATIGERVNVGAGTITCNYDGVDKHVTVIEDGAFIGSNTEIVAPVTIGTNAVIAAGTTLVKDAPAQQLTLTEKQQKTLTDWQRKKKGDK